MSHAELFHQPQGPYLLSHSIGLQPIATLPEVTGTHFGAWAHDPEHAWDSWLGQINRFRQALATLFATDAAAVCPQQNVTGGLTKILGALPPQPGRTKIVLAEGSFPSLGFAIERSPFEAVFVPADMNPTDPEAWRPYFTADVAAVLVTHALSNTGQLIPVQAVVDMAAEHEIYTVVDVAQSAGVVPIDVSAWNASFVVGSCVKWLCGGPGAAFLWVRPDLIDQCRPIDTGWFSHADPFEFDIHRFVDAPDALRFWGGTPSVLPFAVAAGSIELITDIGVDTIRAHNLALTDRVIAGLAPGLIASPSDPERRNGTVIVDPGNRTDMVIAQLADARIAVDHRTHGLRISPHIYTSTADVDSLLHHLVR